MAEEWIANKGIAAKGKKCAERGEVKTVRFTDPIPDEQEIPDEVGDDANDGSDDNGNSGPDGNPSPDSSHSGLDPESPAGPAAAPATPAAPPVIPAAEPEPQSADLDAVPDFPGGLFDEPTLF